MLPIPYLNLFQVLLLKSRLKAYINIAFGIQFFCFTDLLVNKGAPRNANLSFCICHEIQEIVNLPTENSRTTTTVITAHIAESPKPL